MNVKNKLELEHSSYEHKLESFSARLLQAIGGRSARSVAQESGMSDTVLRKYTNGESTPNVERLVAIAGVLGVSVEWLATGREPTPGGTEDSETSIKDNEYSYIPLYEVSSSIGHGTWNDEDNVSSNLAFRNDWLGFEGLKAKHLSAITLRGDSMEPTLKSGDTILIDHSQKDPVEGIYVVLIDGHPYVKRIQRIRNGLGGLGFLRIKSDNPAYDPIDLEVCELNCDNPSHDLGGTCIVGKVVWTGRRI